METVFDTNVLVSALLTANSTASKALNLAENKDTVLYSKAVLEEVSEVLSRPKFSRYVDEDDIVGFLARIHRTWKEVCIIHGIEACRDPKDDKFLEVAINGGATIIVSGDKDLLVLNPYQGVDIITSSEFLRKTEGVV